MRGFKGKMWVLKRKPLNTMLGSLDVNMGKREPQNSEASSARRD